MKKLLILAASTALINGCIYGTVQDANTGSGIQAAKVSVINGNCYGNGCGFPEATDSSGLYVFDAYGDRNGDANTKLILPANGQEAVTLRVSKPGYYSRTFYHKPKYRTVTYDGADYQISETPIVYLCPYGSIDSDGDTICNDAETRYGTDPYNSDTDGDRLSDAAEIFGYDGVDIRYYGADPLRKTVLIEADYYADFKPDQAALDQVIQSFADAPVNNPDGSTGITLAIHLDDQIASADVDPDLNPVWSDFDVIKNKYFETRRDKLFHYALFADQILSAGYSGISRGIPAHDFVVSLGAWPTPGGTTQQQAGTLMHEFGHNLGLRHGGNENANRKLNYISVMSYDYQMPGLTINGTTGIVDYSRLKINAVSSTINEFSAMSGYGGTTESHLDEYSVRRNGVWLSGTASENLDVNNNGVLQNSVSLTAANASQNDWDNISFAAGGSIGDGHLGLSAELDSMLLQVQSMPSYMVEPCLTPDSQ
ncbi:peptidase associated/transthyretin-like domain-containing protein [Kangiella sediminilitoris]|uniref:Uncharacterized protein n=1 Tax=Kangiella sediminilitoris TaxID=1144748 RepID=A0A1B3BDZ4_9GAMM|nr:carboxypeptidase-like regulatory domain-containing protein [Kangiella sediminilitoris]AOE51020.1 hypothetical protein KS2013_2316 [Kangiella sediminilitoris]